MDRVYQIAVIGGGPAGYAAAIYAAKKGADVVLIEKDRLGGTCLNRGCIPTKTYCASAELLFKIRGAARFAIDGNYENFGIDFSKLFQRKNEIVNRQVDGIRQLLKGNRIILFEGSARLEDDNRILIKAGDSNKYIEFKNAIIATGSEPASVKGIKIDHAFILDSTDMLAMEDLPSTLMIIGGGVIGVEFAMIMSLFGVKVYLVEILERILFNEDIMVSRFVEKRLRSLGVDINTGVKIEDLKISQDKVNIVLSNKKVFSTDRMLVAAGRMPVFDIDENLHQKIVGEKGFIKTDEYLRTEIKNIYAAGDVIGGVMLAHKSHYDGEVAVDNILGRKRSVDYRAVPAVIYTTPEVASVGISEEKAREKGIDVRIGRFFIAQNGMAMAKNATDGFVKIVAEKGSGSVIGGCVVAESASEMITTITLAVREKMRFEDISELIWPHPTISESIGEAIRDIHGMAIHKLSL